MKNKPLIWVIAIAIIIIIVWAIIPKASSDKHPRIGVVLPFSGNYASIGEKIKNGLELAKSDLESKNPSLKVELLYNDGCLPKDATSATQKLVNVDKVSIIGANFCAVGLVPSIPITESAHVMNVGVPANSAELLGKKYFFSPNFSVKENAAAIADFAIDTLGAKKVAFIYYNTPFGKDYRQSIGARITARGGTIVADEMTSLDDKDFRTYLAKIKLAKPDAIFVTQLTGALGTILKQAKELGINAPFVGNYQNEDQIVLDTAGTASEGFIINSADPAILNPDNTAFRSAYKARFGTEADVFAANAYDALEIEVPVYLTCKGDADCMTAEFHKVSGYKGVSGTITVNSDGVASKPTIFKIVKNGKFVVYTR